MPQVLICMPALKKLVTIEAGETKFIGTGIAMEIPEGYAGLIYARKWSFM